MRKIMTLSEALGPKASESVMILRIFGVQVPKIGPLFHVLLGSR